MTLSHFSQLVLVKVGLNLRSEASTSYLNYIWWILEPALFVVVFYVVFGILLERGGPGFVAFLVCGQIPYLWYSRSVTNSSGSIIAGRRLISQVYIPKLFFPLVVIIQDFVKQLFVFGLLLAFLVFYGTEIAATWFYFPLIAVTQILFILASGLVAAAIVPIIPDFRYIISTGLMLLMFGSGIFYSYEEFVDPHHQSIFLSNPMAALLKNYRQVLLDGVAPDFGRLALIAVSSICVTVIMSYVLRRYSGEYSRLAIQ